MNYLIENILFQIQIISKLCNFISHYRSPSQTVNNFDSFLDNLKSNLDTGYDVKQVIKYNIYITTKFSYGCSHNPSLHLSCHHQIVYAKFSLKIHYPLPYEREVWHFQKADIYLMRRAINEFNWERDFFNLNINEMVTVFNYNY